MGRLDLLIRGAEIYPGDGPPFNADVGVRGGRIALIAEDVSQTSAERSINACGLILTPGFIDMHAHSALQPFVDPYLAPKVGQGFTTEVINPDGLAPAPVTDELLPNRRRYLMPIEGPGPDPWNWRAFGEYLDALEETRPATSLVPSVGHGAVRELVLGPENREPTPDDIDRMRAELRVAFACGARMLSFGLIYVPGLYAKTDEVAALAQEAGRVGAPIVPHVRDEGVGVLDAVAEFIEVANVSGSPLHLSHLKVLGHHHLIPRLLDLIDDASTTIDISFDQYPYGAGSTTLAAQLPPWSLEGGTTDALDRIQHAETRRRIVNDITHGLPGWQNFLLACGADQIVVAHAGGSRAYDRGKSIGQVARERATSHAEAIVGLLVDSRMDVLIIPHYAAEEHVVQILRHPLMLVGSDGIFGPHPHPRLYGTAARVLGDFALRRGTLPVEEAVARLTARAADRLGLRDRGRIREGLRADLVLIDAAAFCDQASYDVPCVHPPGIVSVLVVGEAVWHDGAPTGARPGGVVRNPLLAVSGSETH